MEYNDLLYNSGPVKFNDYVNNKYNIVHNKLYKDALYKYVYEYISNIISNDILYSLFVCMNNCITEFNDTLFDENYNYDHIYTLSEVNDSNMFYNYIIALIEYIQTSKYENKIYSSFKELHITEIDNYIKYIVANVIILIKILSEQSKTELNPLVYPDSPNSLDVSNFIIRYDNVLYILGENELDVYDSELSKEEVFIFEKQFMSDIHIGYSSDGKFILDIDINLDITKAYDKLYLIVANINKMLFGLFDDITEKYIDSHKIIEKKNEEYWMPSSIIIFNKVYPHTKKVVDLTPYWSTYQDKTGIIYTDLKIIKEELSDSEIHDINYINGNVRLYSKMYDIKYNADVKYINSDTNIEDSFIKETFTNKLKNEY